MVNVPRRTLTISDLKIYSQIYVMVYNHEVDEQVLNQTQGVGYNNIFWVFLVQHLNNTDL